MKIGAYALPESNTAAVFVAPMAGITDRPFRRLARRYGAALAVSEMVSARPELRGSRKTLLRLDHAGEPGPVSVQIAGADPAMLAEAARFEVARRHSGDCQRRRFHARAGEAGAQPDWGRRRDDRPRGAGPAVAVSRDHALPRHRRAARAARAARDGRGAGRAPRRALRSLRRRAGHARRPQAHRLDRT